MSHRTMVCVIHLMALFGCTNNRQVVPMQATKTGGLTLSPKNVVLS
jgi:hypothetical protein